MIMTVSTDLSRLNGLVNYREQCRERLYQTLQKSGLRPIRPIGRKPLNIPVKNIYDALHTSLTITAAAQKLGVSKAYIYTRLPLSEIRELLHQRVNRES